MLIPLLGQQLGRQVHRLPFSLWPSRLPPAPETLCTHLLGDNVALLICELFLGHLLPWNILKLILLQLEKGRRLKTDEQEFGNRTGGNRTAAAAAVTVQQIPARQETPSQQVLQPNHPLRVPRGQDGAQTLQELCVLIPTIAPGSRQNRADCASFMGETLREEVKHLI